MHAGAVAEIKAVLDRSAAAWSAGDLDAFMACYENSPETLYVAGAKVVRGYEAIQNMYAERFAPNTSAAHGTLTMTLIALRLLDPRHAFVVGQYQLEREASQGGPMTGPFSLVLRHTPAGWRITADHTS